MKRVYRRKRRVAFFIFLAVFLILAGVTVFAFSLARSIPDAGRISERTVAESTKIYDRTGKVLLYEIHGEERRTVIPLSAIPDQMEQATIVAEDDNFYKHIGLDGRGILRAFIKNITSGDITQGGSTITQQLVKNSILTSERTFGRKIKEAVLAILLERRYAKDEILELYLNQIPYGANAYGVESAAKTYFAKPAKELTLAEAALLAALPKAPTYYSPYGSRKDELLSRRNWILDRLAEKGFISKEEAEQTKRSSLGVVPPTQRSIRAPHFVFFVREYLSAKYDEEFVERGGLKVITTLDWKLQEEAEKVIKEGAEQNEKTVGAANAALVAIDPKTGDILAMVGSRDYWEQPKPDGCRPGIDCKFDPHVNVAIRLRQPGSAFKPFVYATALKKGYTPETVLFDVPTEFNVNCNADGSAPPGINPKDCYHPQNYDGRFRGPVTLRQALAQSLNLPSVKLLYLAGIGESIQTGRNLGITTLDSPERLGLTLVLGGAEVKLLEMVSAFGAFAADGVLRPYTPILKVENSQGQVLEERQEIAIPALDTQVTRTLNSILSDNNARIPIFNPQSSLYFSNRQVAAKTGTTQDYRDTWVIGYTPAIVAGVWAGNNDNSAMNQTAASVMVAGPVWHNFMERVLERTPPEFFPPPEPIFAAKPALRGIYQAGPYFRIDRISGKLATEYTPPELVEERGYGPVNTILSFIRREDPLGDPPPDPFQDPQYKNWQAAIERWLTTTGFLPAKPPNEYDDLHLPQKRPKLLLTLPSPASNLTAVVVKVQSVFPLQEVSLFINDQLVQAKTAPILTETVRFELSEKLEPGIWRIAITAYDAVGNKETTSQEVQISE